MKKILAIATVVALTACAPNYVVGTSAGIVETIELEGLMWKSWEVSLRQAGAKQTVDERGHFNVVKNTIGFNVEDPVIVRQLQEAMRDGKRVEIAYKQWLVAPVSITNERVAVGVRVLDVCGQ